MRYKNLNGAGTLTVKTVSKLHRVIVGTGAAETITVRHASSDDTIALITGIAEPFGVEFGLDLTTLGGPLDLEFVASGATDFTVIYE